ncbi:MAG: 16S rRNA (uracil(1498)-N(3))-methyltransferase [Chlamydiae bacterium]|nr:16S rRNA (uracil(1498)-N(3))-methyltransferase [Chlamydiota bacterium]
MPNDRFYVNEDLIDQSTLFITDQELHHLQYVMRIKEGEEIEVINGKGKLGKAIVNRFHKQKAEITINNVLIEEKPQYPLILAQGLPRLARLEYIVEKATELGVTEIWLFPAVHTEKKDLSPSQMQRMQQILISSIKQCGRLYLPEIKFMPPLNKWEVLDLCCLFGDTQEESLSILSVLIEKKQKDILWMVGPERGLCPSETAILKSKLKFIGVTLNHNILRTDTAAIAGLSVISAQLLS